MKRAARPRPVGVLRREWAPGHSDPVAWAYRSAEDGSFSAARHAEETDYGGDNSSNQHPHRFVRGRAGEESGNIGAERFRGVHSDDDENDAPGEQGDRHGFIHKVSGRERFAHRLTMVSVLR